MLWIGLTGGLGSGKSTVAKLLRGQGYSVLDADQVARQAVGPGTATLGRIVSRFGKDILDPSGQLNRRRLGERVFADPKELAALEAIVHPEVRELVRQERQRLASMGQTMAFYDVPLLFEKRMERDFDAVVVVTCSEEQQIERAMRRDGLGRDQVIARIRAQMPLAEKTKRADLVIVNDGDEQGLLEQVQSVIQSLRARAPQNPQA